MRILVTIVHYFAAEANPLHGSNDAAKQEERARVVANVVLAYRGMFGRTATLDIASKTTQMSHGSPDQVDLALVTVPGHALLDDAFCARFDVAKLEFQPDNPRMLGFHAHETFSRLQSEYDLFVYTEDDLRPADPDMFAKIQSFNAAFGGSRLLLPNRYEWNPASHAIKTYIDGDLRPGFIDPLLQRFTDQDTLSMDALGRKREFRRARNPHAGFFAITQAQLGVWMRQPHWLDRDCSFVSPLESAATLGIAKTFPIYKPFGGSSDWLELQHLDTRFSALRLPLSSEGLYGLAATGSA